MKRFLKPYSLITVGERLNKQYVITSLEARQNERSNKHTQELE